MSMGTAAALRVGVLVVAALGGGCVDVTPFVCERSAECVRGADEGVCEDTGYCSFADPACDSGRRYAARSSDALSGVCVGEAPMALPVEVALGSDHTCIRDDAGGVWCWGRNDRGQVGDGTDTNRTMPVPVSGLTDVVAIAAGEYHTCAAQRSGAVFCWGDNEQRQVGASDGKWRDTPERVPGVSNAVGLALGEFHSCAVTEAGAVVCWGANDRGQLGRGSKGDAERPGVVGGLDKATTIVADGAHTCARQAERTHCWGKNQHGQLGLGHTRDELGPVLVPWLGDAQQVVAGGEHICALGSDRVVRCAGRNDDGELGAGDDDVDTSGSGDHTVPSEVQGLQSAVALSAGEWFTCARDGDGQAWCWGRGSRGELGDGRMESVRRPARPVALREPAVAISAGERHACALTAAGCVWCWGSNEFGQLGDGSHDHNAAPTRVELACPQAR